MFRDVGLWASWAVSLGDIILYLSVFRWVEGLSDRLFGYLTLRGLVKCAFFGHLIHRGLVKYTFLVHLTAGRMVKFMCLERLTTCGLVKFRFLVILPLHWVFIY